MAFRSSAIAFRRCLSRKPEGPFPWGRPRRRHRRLAGLDAFLEGGDPRAQRHDAGLASENMTSWLDRVRLRSSCVCCSGESGPAPAATRPVASKARSRLMRLVRSADPRVRASAAVPAGCSAGLRRKSMLSGSAPSLAFLNFRMPASMPVSSRPSLATSPVKNCRVSLARSVRRLTFLSRITDTNSLATRAARSGRRASKETVNMEAPCSGAAGWICSMVVRARMSSTMSSSESRAALLP